MRCVERVAVDVFVTDRSGGQAQGAPDQDRIDLVQIIERNLTAEHIQLNSKRLRGSAKRAPQILVRSQVLIGLEDHIRRRYVTQTAAADAWNVSPSFVTAVLKNRRPPTDQMLSEIGYKRVDAYMPIGSEVANA